MESIPTEFYVQIIMKRYIQKHFKIIITYKGEQDVLLQLNQIAELIRKFKYTFGEALSAGSLDNRAIVLRQRGFQKAQSVAIETVTQ